MARTQTTPATELLSTLMARARRLGRPESEVVEETLRRYLGLDGLLEQMWTLSPEELTEEQALELAYSELRAARAKRG